MVSRQLRQFGAMLIIAAVLMIPIAAVYIQVMTGFWRDGPGYNLGLLSWFSGSNAPVFLSALVCALLVRTFHRIPFLTGIAAISAFFVMADLTYWLAGNQLIGWSLAAAFNNHVLPASIILLAYAMDRRGMAREDAGWLHRIGVFFAWLFLTFWVSEALPDTGNRLAVVLLYALFSLGLLGLALFLWRGAYAVFGIMGLLWCLDHVLRPLIGVLSLLPVALIVAVILNLWMHGAFEHHARRLESAMLERLPGWLVRLRPRSAT